MMSFSKIYVKRKKSRNVCKKQDKPSPTLLMETGKTTQKPGMIDEKKTFEHSPANGQVLIIMRYKSAIDRRMRNSLIRMKGRIHQPGTEGYCLGLTTHIEILDTASCSDWSTRDDWCLVLFAFPSWRHARCFYESEPELRQPDFLSPSDRVELFAMELRYFIKPGNMTFHWLEIYNVRNARNLQEEFVDKTADILDDQQVNHGIIFVKDSSSPDQLHRLKESWISHNDKAYIVVNVFDTKSSFDNFYYSETYKNLKRRRAELCETLSLVFTIDPNITEAPAKHKDEPQDGR